MNNQITNAIGAYMLVALSLFIALAGAFPQVDIVACMIAAALASFLLVWVAVSIPMRSRGAASRNFFALPIAVRSEILIARCRLSVALEIGNQVRPRPLFVAT